MCRITFAAFIRLLDIFGQGFVVCVRPYGYDARMNHASCDINKKRACVKMALIALLAALALIILVIGFDRDVLDTLKHSLSLWTVLALVVIINLVSFVCLVALYAGYRWVRSDLKPRADDDLDL